MNRRRTTRTLIVHLFLAISGIFGLHGMDVPRDVHSLPTQIVQLLHEVEAVRPKMPKQKKRGHREEFLKSVRRKLQTKSKQLESVSFKEHMFSVPAENNYAYLNDVRLLASLLLVQQKFMEVTERALFLKLCLSRWGDRLYEFIKVHSANTVVDKLGKHTTDFRFTDPIALGWLYRHGCVNSNTTITRKTLILQALQSRSEELRNYGRFHKMSLDVDAAKESYEGVCDLLMPWVAIEPDSEQEKFLSECDSRKLELLYQAFFKEGKNLQLKFCQKIIQEQKAGTFDDSKDTHIDVWFHSTMGGHVAGYRGLHSTYADMYRVAIAQIHATIESFALTTEQKAHLLSNFLKLPFRFEGLGIDLLQELPKELPVMPSSQVMPSCDSELWKITKKHYQAGSQLPKSCESFAEAGGLPRSQSASLCLPESVVVAEGNEFDLVTELKDREYVIAFPFAYGAMAYVFRTQPQNAVSTSAAVGNFQYTQWVEDWFIAPCEALHKHGYRDQSQPRAKYFREASWAPALLHAFPREIDQYMSSYGEFYEKPNRRNAQQIDTYIDIPGMLIYPEGKARYPGNGKREQTGVFRYIIDHTGKCFHRMFELIDQQEMLAHNWQNNHAFFEQEFPQLGSS